MAAPLSAADAADWEYLGEGGVHIILRHRDAGANAVLRLRKARQRPEAPPADLYARRVIASLLGAQYLSPTCPVLVGPDFLTAVARSIEGVRAPHRSPDRLDAGNTDCLLEQDLTVITPSPPPRAEAHGALTELAQLCFELKPKSALLPAADALDGAWPLQLCRFCALQLSRCRADPSYRPSSFCPLRLFSGERGQVRAMLGELVLCPQNNLGVFVDGLLCYGKGEAEAGRLLDALDSQLCPLAATVHAGMRTPHGSARGPHPEQAQTAAQHAELPRASDAHEPTGDFEWSPTCGSEGGGSVARRQDADDALGVLREHEGLQALLPEIRACQAARAELAQRSPRAGPEHAGAEQGADGSGGEDGESLAEHAVLRLYLRAVEAVLLQEPLLARLRAAQAATDLHGIAAVHRAYERLLANSAGDEAAVQALVDAHARRLCGLEPTAGGSGHARPAAAAAADVSLVHDWLLALTLRDCSLMLTLRALPAAAPHPPSRGSKAGALLTAARRVGTVAVELEDAESGASAELLFAYSLGVVDLDLKPVAKVCKHVREAEASARLASLLSGGAPQQSAGSAARSCPLWTCKGLRRH
ncbi:inositol-pentakisphosphate 2-kinase [Pavlovales sp. CCMP2436]|nr:inositol-pentakisphosphate 2-kinase [Pavlovales sp. CCMP2436]